jgi:hypothetical protein
MNIKNIFRVAVAVAAGYLPDVMMIAGACLVSYGAALIYFPAGYLVGGAFAISFGYLLARGKQ